MPKKAIRYVGVGKRARKGDFDMLVVKQKQYSTITAVLQNGQTQLYPVVVANDTEVEVD